MNCCCEPLRECAVRIRPHQNPVEIYLSKPLSQMAQNNCFKLKIPKCLLTSINARPVVIVDDDLGTIPFLQGCSGNFVHYDQLVKAACRRGCLDLNVFFGTNGPEDAPLHIINNTRLPKSCFDPAQIPSVAAAAGPVAAQVAAAASGAKKTSAAS